MPRRALATRNAAWARGLARALGRAGVRPNAVSLASIACAGMAAVAFVLSSAPGLQPRGAPDAASLLRAALLAAAAACIQLRLLCNLLDGMLAVEEGFRSKAGELYNELPDRLADVLILVGAGYAARALPYGIALGWAAAVLALLTAYVRALGGSLGPPQPFIGPMAKQHRMFTLTVAAFASVPEAWLGRPLVLLRTGLIVIVAGALVTVARRTRHLFREVNTQ